jgi:cytochrome c-type biogenesis protein CcmH
MVPVSRLVLIGAGLIAAVSVGVTTLRPKPADAPPEAVAESSADVAAMIPQIEAKLKANPNDAEGWRMLGMSFVETGRFAEGATAYKRAAELKPQNAESWSNLGEALVLASQGKFPTDAKSAFATALARNPKDTRARYFIAVEKDIAGDHRGAIDGWIALLKDSAPDAPWQAEVRGLIASVATREKIDVRARMAELPALPAQSGSEATQQAAMIRSMVDGLAKKLEANPKDVDGWIMLMRSHQALGQSAEAKAAKKAALSANPENAVSINAAAAQLGVNEG